MKAVVYDRSEKLKFLDMPMPQPEPDQVLVRVSNTGFCGSDHSLIGSGGLVNGYILGHEVSGEIADMGPKVAGCKIGTRVIVRPTYCGHCRECLMNKPYLCRNNRRTIGIGDLPGGFAEYVKVYPEMLIPVPAGLDSQNAALAEPFAASFHAINVSGSKGGAVLVIGGGPIGLALVRLLKILGFGPIALSEPVEEKRIIAEQFGADILVDPFKDNVVMRTSDDTQECGYDTVFECSGAPGSVTDAMNCCANGGSVCIVSVIMKNIEITPMLLNFREIWVTGSYSNTHEENRQCLDWMSHGRLDGRAMISDTTGLEELPRIYKERIETGRAIKVMLKIGEEF